jgi:hypothetical protein
MKLSLKKASSAVALALACLAPSAVAQAAAPSPTAFNRETYNYTTSLSTSQEANRYQTLVLQSTNGSKVAALHAANPNLKILMYQDLIWSKSSDPSGLTTCTPYSSDSASHPTWFLKDQNGNRVLNKGYAGDYLMDVGNPAYQQACVAHAAALAKQYGFDGIFFDDANAYIGWSLASGVRLAQYQSVSAWQAAEYSQLSYVGPALRAQQLLVVANIGGSTVTAGLWAKWTTPLDGSEEESWTDGGAGLAQQVSAWPTKLANAAWSEAHGKLALLHSLNGTETGNTYGLGSMLLVGAGRDSYSTSNTNTITQEVWYPEYSTAQQLGAPAGAYTRLANGVYERVFANGIVLVNASNNTIPSFSLGGGIYSGSQLTNAKSVSMGPTSGLILLRVG